MARASSRKSTCQGVLFAMTEQTCRANRLEAILAKNDLHDRQLVFHDVTASMDESCNCLLDSALHPYIVYLNVSMINKELSIITSRGIMRPVTLFERVKLRWKLQLVARPTSFRQNECDFADAHRLSSSSSSSFRYWASPTAKKWKKTK